MKTSASDFLVFWCMYLHIDLCTCIYIHILVFHEFRYCVFRFVVSNRKVSLSSDT